jgi:hypothetical protein
MQPAMKWSLLGFAATCAAVVAYLTWVITMGIPLSVEVRDGSVWIDTQVFGEQSSSISRIRLQEIATGRTVWEAESTADCGTSPVALFSLKPGENSLPERLQAFRTVIPATNGSFEIVPDREYRVRVWGKTKLNRNSRRFTAPRIATMMETPANDLINLPVRTLSVRYADNCEG